MRLEELLKSNARAMPDAIALLEPSGRRYTYRALEDLAENVADDLRGVGVGRGDRVGVCASKRIETLAALFGVLKAGAAYVPVDPAAPAVRSASIFAACEVQAILVDSECRNKLSFALREHGYNVKVHGEFISGIELLSPASHVTRSDDDLAYIFYTSGSTGKPKGVVHTHASALAFIDWCSEEFQPTREDRFSSHAPIFFDLSILDIFVAIKHGAAILLIGADEGKQPRTLCEYIAEHRITFWCSTPTVLRAMIQFGNLANFDHSSLRIVCFAGEVFPIKHLRALVDSWPGPTYYNLYGPTETNVCTFYRLEKPLQQTNEMPIPIGKACSNDEVTVMSPQGEKMPAGEKGELWVHGSSVMQGYWDAPDKNSEVFEEFNGCCWYRTGDIVSEREDGVLVYWGRQDRMVKRRGYRIELDEIEAALSRHENISEVAVVALSDASNDTYIVAFYSVGSDKPPSLIQMKRYCSKVLPIYMSPDHFQALPRMKYTSTGKVDFQRLKEMASGLLSN